MKPFEAKTSCLTVLLPTGLRQETVIRKPVGQFVKNQIPCTIEEIEKRFMMSAENLNPRACF